MKKESLDVETRLKLIQFLPTKGDKITLTLTLALLEKMDLTSDEINQLEIRNSVGENGKSAVTWNRKKEKIKVVEFNDREFELLVKSCRVLHEQEQKGELDISDFKIYSRFVEPYLSETGEEKQEK